MGFRAVTGSQCAESSSAECASFRDLRGEVAMSVREVTKTAVLAAVSLVAIVVVSSLNLCAQQNGGD